MTDSTPPISADLPRRRWLWIALLIAMAIGFAVHAVMAARTKSSTYDEPVHTLSSWMIVNSGDFRVNPEHPALWKYVAGLGLVGQPLAIVPTAPEAMALFTILERQWWFTIQTLYRAPGQPPLYGEQLVMRARVAMSLFAIALALIVARWAWVWGGPREGPMAAFVATALLIFDPNFLAHGALVTNDVAAATCIALASYFCWRLGTHLTWRNVILFALACAAGLGIKFTCLLLAPMLGVPLLYRALESETWRVGATRAIRGRLARVAVVGAVCIASIVAGLVSLWPMYQFRNAPTPFGLRFSDDYPRMLLAYNGLVYERRKDPYGLVGGDAQIIADIPGYRPSATAQTIFWLSEKRLVPQAWGYGLSYANARSFARAGFLLGDYSDHGFLLFFPLATLFKTPVMTLAIALASMIAGLSLVRQRLGDARARWKLVCLLVPPTIYFAIAMSSPLNIGLRHVLPAFVPVFVACGLAMSRLASRWRPARFIVPAAVAILAIETTSVFPNYLSFFNSPSGGAEGGLALLSDSNLDWGQDLPALATWYRDWRSQNPSTPFYLAYWGSADPRAYGIDFINGQPGYAFDMSPPVFPDGGGVYAVSASFLQGLSPEELRSAMANLRNQQPMAVVNGTIYIYALAPGRPSTNASTTTSATTTTTPATTRPAS